jgi:hypothetical protein
VLQRSLHDSLLAVVAVLSHWEYGRRGIAWRSADWGGAETERRFHTVVKLR